MYNGDKKLKHTVTKVQLEPEYARETKNILEELI